MIFYNSIVFFQKLLEEKGYLKAEKTALEKHCSMLKEKEEVTRLLQGTIKQMK